MWPGVFSRNNLQEQHSVTVILDSKLCILDDILVLTSIYKLFLGREVVVVSMELIVLSGLSVWRYSSFFVYFCILLVRHNFHFSDALYFIFYCV